MESFINERIAQSIISLRVLIDGIYYDTYVPDSDSGYIEVDSDLFWDRRIGLVRDIVLVVLGKDLTLHW